MSFEFLAEDDAVDSFEKKERSYAGGPKGPRARTEEQKMWDEGVQKAYDGTGIFAVQIAPDMADDARKFVNSATRHLGLTSTEGVPKPGSAEGTVILAWQIRYPKPRPNARGPRKNKKTTEDSGE